MAPAEYYPAMRMSGCIRTTPKFVSIPTLSEDSLMRFLHQAKIKPVSPGHLLDQLSPYARVATAVAPFCVVMLARLIWGKSQTMSWLITASTVWFVINVLAAPYSAPMRQEIQNLLTQLF
jgi:hypothetical protein